MTAQTYCPHPREVFKRFDILTAATTHQVLNEVSKDSLGIYSEIIRYTKLHSMTEDEGRADILYLLTEEAFKRPEKLVERYNSWYWRFFFTSFCKNIFGTSGSARRNWNSAQVIQYFEDAPDPFEPVSNPEKEHNFFTNAIELVDQAPFLWWERKLWAIYHLDANEWLKKDWVDDKGNFIAKAPKKITYDYISKRTEVSRTTVYKAIQKVDTYIKDNYEIKFGSPFT